jgi:hypothetical protein
MQHEPRLFPIAFPFPLPFESREKKKTNSFSWHRRHTRFGSRVTSNKNPISAFAAGWLVGRTKGKNEKEHRLQTYGPLLLQSFLTIDERGKDGPHSALGPERRHAKETKTVDGSDGTDDPFASKSTTKTTKQEMESTDAGRPFEDTEDTPPSRFFVSLSVLTHTTKAVSFLCVVWLRAGRPPKPVHPRDPEWRNEKDSTMTANLLSSLPPLAFRKQKTGEADERKNGRGIQALTSGKTHPLNLSI